MCDLKPLQLPFGPGNKQIMDKLPMKGDPLNVNKHANQFGQTPKTPAGKPSTPTAREEDARRVAAEVDRNAKRTSGFTTLDPTPQSTSLG